jgi:hypothetical protein
MDNAEALRALDKIIDRLDKCGIEDEYDMALKLYAHLTDPGYARVPEEAIRKNAPCELDINEQLVWAEGWNACRESMLAATGDKP